MKYAKIKVVREFVGNNDDLFLFESAIELYQRIGYELHGQTTVVATEKPETFLYSQTLKLSTALSGEATGKVALVLENMGKEENSSDEYILNRGHSS